MSPSRPYWSFSKLSLASAPRPLLRRFLALIGALHLDENRGMSFDSEFEFYRQLDYFWANSYLRDNHRTLHLPPVSHQDSLRYPRGRFSLLGKATLTNSEFCGYLQVLLMLTHV